MGVTRRGMFGRSGGLLAAAAATALGVEPAAYAASVPGATPVSPRRDGIICAVPPKGYDLTDPFNARDVEVCRQVLLDLADGKQDAVLLPDGWTLAWLLPGGQVPARAVTASGEAGIEDGTIEKAVDALAHTVDGLRDLPEA